MVAVRMHLPDVKSIAPANDSTETRIISTLMQPYYVPRLVLSSFHILSPHSNLEDPGLPDPSPRPHRKASFSGWPTPPSLPRTVPVLKLKISCAENLLRHPANRQLLPLGSPPRNPASVFISLHAHLCFYVFLLLHWTRSPTRTGSWRCLIPGCVPGT